MHQQSQKVREWKDETEESEFWQGRYTQWLYGLRSIRGVIGRGITICVPWKEGMVSYNTLRDVIADESSVIEDAVSTLVTHENDKDHS